MHRDVVCGGEPIFAGVERRSSMARFVTAMRVRGVFDGQTGMARARVSRQTSVMRVTLLSIA
ncbi:hypothetical protein [Burkholderia pseudomallei]|uniref:hypothetical protein n=1 Tax=Burkholderia pseudomallei TaxID=28450 RepID=UPI0015C3BB02|nr:hypothetical protein [Burkholderia pseudomallei]MCQ8216280.1 hypothetical protein [Burkholderia pseudomallei]